MSTQKMQPVIHIGFAKCASTLLQRKVFPEVPGYEYVDCRDYTGLGTTYLSDLDPSSPVLRLPSMNNVILSNHAFLHYHLPLPWRKYGKRVRIDITVANLSVLCRDRGKIVVVLRRQDSAIDSRIKYAGDQYARPECFFLDYPMRGDGWSKEQKREGNPVYKAQCLANVYGGTFTGSYDYFDILQRLATGVDKKRIHVLLYEDLVHDKGAFLDGLAAIFEQDMSAFMPSLMKKVNKSPETPVAPHPFFTRGIGREQRLKSFLLRRAGRLFARPLGLSEEWKEEFLDLYREGNRRLADSFDLPLKKYGYY